MTNLEVIKKTLIQKKPLLEKYGIIKIGIFGSYLHGQETPESDIDILIDIKRPSQIGLLELIEMENQLSEEFHTKVDLVIESTLKPMIGKRILEEVQYL